MGKLAKSAALAFLFATISPVAAADPQEAPFDGEPSMFSLRYDPERPRSDIVAPIFSLFLPGLDQWWEAQFAPAGSYTGMALASAGYLPTAG